MTDRSRQSTPNRPGPSTHAVHAGERRWRAHNSLTVPIVQTSVYTFDDIDALLSFTEEHMFWDEPEREEYGRHGNPTVRAVEAKIAELEGAQDAVLLSSGMGAVTSTLLLMLKQGDHMILTDECYLTTLNFCRQFLPRYGIEATVIRHGDYEALEAAIRPHTKLVFSESPTNPYNHCVDFDRLVAIAKANGLKTIIDTTFATPVNLRALDYGIDLVIHSATKYLGGHNDLMAGVVAGSFDLTTPLRQAQSTLGNIVDPNTAYLLLRGLKTLALRIARHNASATAIAAFLEDHPKVRKVWYPSLSSHHDHELATRTMNGFGGVVSFEPVGGVKQAYKLMDAMTIPTIGPSLGGAESIISPLAIMGYAKLAPEERQELRINDELIRFCIGIEDTDDLIADLTQALETIE